MGEESDITQQPENSGGDIVHTLVRAGLSLAPIVGGPAVELLGLVIVPPIEKRRDEWIEEIARCLLELERKVGGLRLEDLSDSDTFVTTFLHASQAAIRNHQREKREALRNAVLNSALPSAPDDDLQMIFLNYVDTFTSWHLRIMRFLDDLQSHSQKYAAQHSGWDWDEPQTVLEDVYPELNGKPGFQIQILRDLSERGLSRRDNLRISVMTTLHGRKAVFVSQTTPMGKQFLEFITSPIPNDEQAENS